jgi:mRNA interferase MazF
MNRGDVVLCRFPHASQSLLKIRPALIVQSDYYNQRISNVLVAGITTKMDNASDRAHLLIDVATPEGQQSGLRQNSLVSCINLAVVPSTRVDRVVGSLPHASMQMIDRCLRAALAV